MSAIAHPAGRTRAATHRALVFFLAAVLALVAVAVTTTAVLLARDDAPALAPGSSLDTSVDTCFGAPVGSAC